MSSKWSNVITNALEASNPIYNIEDPKERFKVKKAKERKAFLQKLKIDRMSYNKPKKNDSKKEEEAEEIYFKKKK